MMSELIRSLRVHRKEIDPDILADYSYILGDLNYRMNSTFTELMPLMPDIIKLKNSLD
jgi:hypothetical protein